MLKSKYYAGIGSRKTPEWILNIFFKEAQRLSSKGMILRSGAADGADSYFESGCDSVDGAKEIFLPWKCYNYNDSSFETPSQKAIDLSMKFHPNPSACSVAVKKLHGRNAEIILGKNLDSPVLFVLCWSKSNGGTNQGIRIAKEYNIPVFNFHNKMTINKYIKFLYGNDLIDKNKLEGTKINDLI